MSTNIFRGVRPVDAALAVLLGAVATWLSMLNIDAGPHADTRVDSHSWWQLPLFVAAAVTVMWWRRSLIWAVSIASALMLIHNVAFDHLIRCGAGLPLVFVLTFLCGFAYPDRRRRLISLGLTVLLGVLVLMWDTAAGPGILPVIVLIQAGLYGLGRLVAQRMTMAGELSRRNDELRTLRDDRAALEVSNDRAQLSARLEELLDERLSQLAATADQGRSADPTDVPALLMSIEEGSRQTLGQMREIVGQLRGGEVALAPAPSVAHLDALLARHVSGGSRLQVSGDPRVLPASVELSAYRIVEHLITALDDRPAAPVGVTMTFTDEALEIMVAGSVSKGSNLRDAVARARERTVLHAGSIELKVSRGRARVLARLPVLRQA
jgi:signal transduction histidine kinase